MKIVEKQSEEPIVVKMIEKKPAEKKVVQNYTTIIVSKLDKTKIREFKLKFMTDNKIYKLSDIGLLLKLMEFYDRYNNK